MGKINELSAIYNELSENWPQSGKYKELIRRFSEEKNQFLEKVGRQNQNDVESLCDNVFAAGSELAEEFFYKGFSLAVQVLEQALKNK